MNKPIEDFKIRFNKALLLQAIKPVELSEKTGLSRSTISHYMSGYTKPKSDKLYAIAKALDVNEAWLMGFDVPMERNNSEDPRIIERDVIFENIESILNSKGWTLSCDSYDDYYFTIKNINGQTITGLYDYEIISRYKSLKKKGKITADLLVSSESAFFKYLESLGYHIGKDDPEHKPFIHYGNGAVTIDNNALNDLRTKIDNYTKTTVDAVILKLNEIEIRKERLEKEHLAEYLLKAAQERTDTEVTDEMRKYDDDIMNDEDF